MVTLTHFLEGNPLPPHRLLFSISSKGSFICTFPQTEQYIPRPLINQLWTTGGIVHITELSLKSAAVFFFFRFLIN